MSKYKYINEFIVDDVLSLLQEKLEKEFQVDLSEEDISLLKEKFLNKCPYSTFSEAEFSSDYEAFRIVIDYGEGVEKELVFYPHLVNEFEKHDALERYVLNNNALKRAFAFWTRMREKDFRRIILKICRLLCKLLSVSLFLDFKVIKEKALRMSVHKKIVEIRKGIVKPEYGESYNLNEETKHIDWYPYVCIDEWSIFKDVVWKFSDD